MQPSVLFLGGTGRISASCVAEAVGLGFRVSVVTRGRSALRPLPGGVEALHADLADDAGLAAVLAGREFDVVADFLSFHPDRLGRNLDLFAGRVGQYVFISTASAYAKPVPSLPIRESMALRNPYWQYSRDKIACEDLLVSAYRDGGFPATIVRPSHTYDETLLPTLGHWTDVARMRAGKPVVVHGDGTSQWTLTHADDFAVAFVGLLGHPASVGEAFTITGTHAPTWNQIYTWLGQAAGVEPELVHVASETIAMVAPDKGPGLVGDKAHSMVFDCSKVSALVPEFRTTITYDQAVHEQIAWFDAHPEAQEVDTELDAVFDRLVTGARSF